MTYILLDSNHLRGVSQSDLASESHLTLGYISSRKVSRQGGKLRRKDLAFGARLVDAMTEARISVQDLAAKVPAHEGTVSRWRGGEVPVPARVERIAGLLGVRAKWLKTEEGERRLPKPTEVASSNQSATRAALELDRAVADLDRARATLAQLRASLGITSVEPGESAWIGVARRSGAGSDSPLQAGDPPGSATR